MELHDDPCPRLKSITCDGSGEHMQGHASNTPAATLLYPLILGSSGIRLISLLPGSFEQDIHCEIAVYDLSSRPDYKAAPYTWADEAGNVDPCRTLLVSGQSLRITRNCENALRRIRNPRDVRVIWIDAVCINQDDVDERGHQV
ncbi:hypothetical protein RRF57_010395 [Xylaria bambusicola]|uniref:Heterokaryon incompatibility domain-containing protein n=1 Tax=Xylaria bambusicola TaxID=326684 RepID=A0AAN7Z8H1_9PEZI